MIAFEEIIQEKDKQKRDLLIKEKLSELNDTCNSVEINTNSIMAGFISKKSKMQFSDCHFDMNIGLGSIYGMKEDNYFYEFFDFLADHNLTTKQNVIEFISPFLKMYFDEQGKKDNDRGILFDDIWRQLDAMYEDKERFNRCKDSWLDIGIFKDRSAAECTEHACVTQNLLTFCDIDSCYISGHMKSNKSDEDHAFNIFKMDENFYLLDSTNPNCLFDSSDNYVGCKSFFYRIQNDKVIDFMKNNSEIKLPKCNFMKKSDGTIMKVDNDNYIYTTSSKFLNEEDINIFLNDSKKIL